MDFNATLASFAEALGSRVSRREGQVAENLHIVDQLIRERTTRLSTNPLWPVARPILYRIFHYRQAVAMADDIAEISGVESLVYISALLSLDMTVKGREHIPERGAFILAPSHPTGIADGIAVFDLLKDLRPDFTIFANRDALRVNSRFRDVLIPVEWRPNEKSHAKSRDTLEMTARAFADEKAIVLFPAGRIAHWHGGRLTERPWQTSVVALARRYEVPVVPVNITARNSGLFYLMSRYSTEMRDMTLFHELLNKRDFAYTLTIGRPIPPEHIVDGDAADVTARLQTHTLEALLQDPKATFRPLIGEPEKAAS